MVQPATSSSAHQGLHVGFRAQENEILAVRWTETHRSVNADFCSLRH